MAGPLGVTHFLITTKTSRAVYLRVCRVPHGPTLTFRVCSFTFASEVLSALRRFAVQPIIFQQPPVLVMSGFLDEHTGLYRNTESSSGHIGLPTNIPSAHIDSPNCSRQMKPDNARDTEAPRPKVMKRDMEEGEQVDGAAQNGGHREPLPLIQRKLIVTMFQNMFASLNVSLLKVPTITRVLLLSYNPLTSLIDLRH